MPYLKYADEPLCGVRALDRRPFSRALSIKAEAWGPGTPGVRAFQPLGLDFCHRRLTNHPHTHKGLLDPQRERAGPTAAGLSELTALFFSFPPLRQPDCYGQTKGERRDVERGKERAEERAEERGKGGKPKERRLGPFIWGDCDKWLPFCWAVHSHCSVGALGDKRVFERERKKDRQTRNDRHLAIYILLAALRALRTGAEGEMS